MGMKAGRVEFLVNKYVQFKQFIRSVIRFLKNIYVFKRTLWVHRNYDYDSYFVFIKEFTDDLQTLKNPFTVGWDDRMKKAKIIGEYANRVWLDEYEINKFEYSIEKIDLEGDLSSIKIYATPKHDFPVSTEHIYKLDLRKQDLDSMHSLLNKHILTFWD